ncbi:ABC-type anion transport protein [Myxococcus stipitatus DSM 14675]|uniref:ABC-type anion transport protein n=1 Tax=Myxococcus stipitatus (strain DSM 14675 / JCM 12634 / Mx s8) TaxID=1278073 RepID=L7U723_MYXSD|nr:ABC transporter permease subunit [Myxococcus stipitatus]AGC42289.1 ABC-type anion transport protein [Myxococcus stipitatus DSM 14675]
MKTTPSVTWGESNATLARGRRFSFVDVLVIAGLAGALFGGLHAAHEWTGALRPSVDIDLSPRALPEYTFLSMSRGLIAYALSLTFTLVYGYWAAKDRVAERVLLPLLDILQSIPVLGFMPGLVLALVAAFPTSNVGLELAAVLMIFTGQAWNMTFSYYHSLRSVPSEQREAATVYRFSRWQQLKWVELPFATIGLVWNSMMSMAGGWFFLMINEAFVLGTRDFRLPGLGSYMSVAVAHGDVPAMLWAILAMTTMIVFLDQVLWRPVVVWAQKFRVEEGGQAEAMDSWFLDLLRRSRLLGLLRSGLDRLSLLLARPRARRAPAPSTKPSENPLTHHLSHVLFAVLVVLLLIGAYRLVLILREVSLAQWGRTLGLALVTLGRVLLSTFLGTLWAVPAGLAIGLSPRASRLLQPVIQVVASFPAPMLFPVVIAGLAFAGVGLGWGSILLMLLGTQWYILFNVVAGATAIPADLREMSRAYGIRGWLRLRTLFLPALFPYLLTGWMTAAGGAWNASIVAELAHSRGETLVAPGLGSQISQAAAGADFPLLAVSVVVMSAVLVTFNRLVWKRLHTLARTRFSLS